MHIVIFGSGGIGGAFGGHLAQSGAKVTFIARGAHLKAMRDNGLKIRFQKGDDFIIHPVAATDDPRSIKDADVILVCTKTWQLASILDDLNAMLGSDTFVVPLLNSIEATDILVSALGADRVLGGLTYTVSYIVEPGVVHSGGLHQIIFGELDGKASARVDQLAEIINATGVLKAEAVPDIRVRQWEKFTWISSASVIGAITRMPAGGWRDVPETRKLFGIVLREAFDVAAASGVTLSPEKFESVYLFVDGLQPTMTTSMQRDIQDGKPSELAYQIGYIVREGARLGVPVPASALLYAALLPQDRAAQINK